MLYSCIPLEQLLHLTLHSLILYNTTLSRSKEIVDISLDLYYSCFAVTLPLSNFHDIANEPVSDYTHLFLFFDSDEIISESHFVQICLLGQLVHPLMIFFNLGLFFVFFLLTHGIIHIHNQTGHLAS